MTHYLIGPRDPLVLRDGRPNRDRSAPRTLLFPYPQTVAGALRTRLGSNDAGSFELQDVLGELLASELRGPLPVRTAAEGDHALMWPRPLDGIWINGPSEDPGGFHRHVSRVTPGAPPQAIALSSAGDYEMLPVSPRNMPSGKTPPDLPAFVSWPSMERWLSSPPDVQEGDEASWWLEGAWRGPALDRRTHVMMDSERDTGVDGKLFSVSGLSFAGGLSTPEYGIWSEFVPSEKLAHRPLRPGPLLLGGEGRVSQLSVVPNNLPAIPEPVRAHVKRGSSPVLVRALLATPAVFELGSRPGETCPWLRQTGELNVRVVCALSGKPVTVSGWDMAKGKPKPSKRLVEAGSVYWLRLQGPPDERERWLESVWLQNASCDAQDRRDGYGLTLIGVP